MPDFSERYDYGKRAADKAAAGETGQGSTRLGSHNQPCNIQWCNRPECRGWRARARELAKEQGGGK